MKSAVYLRTATFDRNEKQHLQAQREQAEQYCTQHGIAIHGFYIDRGVSGLTALAQRPEGARLLTDARTGAFDVVLVPGEDRVARDMEVFSATHRELASLGIQIHSFANVPNASDDLWAELITRT